MTGRAALPLDDPSCPVSSPPRKRGSRRTPPAPTGRAPRPRAAASGLAACAGRTGESALSWIPACAGMTSGRGGSAGQSGGLGQAARRGPVCVSQGRPDADRGHAGEPTRSIPAGPVEGHARDRRGRVILLLPVSHTRNPHATGSPYATRDSQDAYELTDRPAPSKGANLSFLLPPEGVPATGRTADTISRLAARWGHTPHAPPVSTPITADPIAVAQAVPQRPHPTNSPSSDTRTRP